MTDRKKAAPKSSPKTSHIDYTNTWAAPTASKRAADTHTTAWGRTTSAKGFTRRNRLRVRQELEAKLSRAEAAGRLFAEIEP
jgi:hypothetical protein